MSSRSGDTIPARIYPWWLLLVGFIIGVLLTFFVMYGRAQTVTVYRDSGMPYDIQAQATQMVHDATMTAQGFSEAMANAYAAQMQPAARDPLLMTATAMMIQATQQAAQP